jgi:hypothetical protein
MRGREEGEREGWGKEYQNTLYLCMKIAQCNSLKAVENRGEERYGVKRTIEGVNMINVQYMRM